MIEILFANVQDDKMNEYSSLKCMDCFVGRDPLVYQCDLRQLHTKCVLYSEMFLGWNVHPKQQGIHIINSNSTRNCFIFPNIFSVSMLSLSLDYNHSLHLCSEKHLLEQNNNFSPSFIIILCLSEFNYVCTHFRI